MARDSMYNQSIIINGNRGFPGGKTIAEGQRTWGCAQHSDPARLESEGIHEREAATEQSIAIRGAEKGTGQKRQV